MTFNSDFWSGHWGKFPPQNVPFLSSNILWEQKNKNISRRLALVLAYNGEPFAGWQVQPGISTIQGELEKVLSRLCNHLIRVHGSSRTDTGVHAWGQVASFDTSSQLNEKNILIGLRALLPPEIYPRILGQVPQNFHARFSALAKTYDYYIWPQAGPSLFQYKYLWPLKYILNEQDVRQTLAILPGLHNLKAFSSKTGKQTKSILRLITEARLDINAKKIWRFRLTANGFSRHSIRNLVGTLIQVGTGRLQPKDVIKMFMTGSRIKSGPKAPGYALYLNRIYY